ncbi:hypothetical protein FQN60_012504 [Etheostoma spectabile]|uniref:Integrase catalytic domain-containing protein n=1 Tax=Etheostoma spectabile TaxID=54343 RepID=A0A5J5DPY6_9PERO|nr:hypothetical protein FQN60_012504 [Etheostoma spectabile]
MEYRSPKFVTQAQVMVTRVFLDSDSSFISWTLSYTLGTRDLTWTQQLWRDIYPMKSSTSQATIEKPRQSFSVFGLPKMLVSDSGACFTSSEFESFMEKNPSCELLHHTPSGPVIVGSGQTMKRHVDQVRARVAETVPSIESENEEETVLDIVGGFVGPLPTSLDDRGEPPPVAPPDLQLAPDTRVQPGLAHCTSALCIPNVNLRNQFFAVLDQHRTALYGQKAARTGKISEALRDILKIYDLQAVRDVNMKRALALRALPVYMREEDPQFFKTWNCFSAIYSWLSFGTQSSTEPMAMAFHSLSPWDQKVFPLVRADAALLIFRSPSSSLFPAVPPLGLMNDLAGDGSCGCGGASKARRGEEALFLSPPSCHSHPPGYSATQPCQEQDGTGLLDYL